MCDKWAKKKIRCSLRSNVEFISVGWHKHKKPPHTCTTCTYDEVSDVEKRWKFSMCIKMKWRKKKKKWKVHHKMWQKGRNRLYNLVWRALFQTEIQRPNSYYILWSQIEFSAVTMAHQMITMPHFYMRTNTHTHSILLNWTFEFSKFRLKTFSIYFIITIVMQCSVLHKTKGKC